MNTVNTSNVANKKPKRKPKGELGKGGNNQQKCPWALKGETPSKIKTKGKPIKTHKGKTRRQVYTLIILVPSAVNTIIIPIIVLNSLS